MRVLSLFDGISCARVALERADIYVERYFASEVDKYAIQVSAKNNPEIIQIGDVKMVAHKDAPIHYKLNDIDLLIGGSPCQDLSIAKKNRKGLDGERSGLFWEYVRILNEVKPKYFILENVASMPQKDKDIISETLGVQPVMINASLVSAQNRKRLFWVGRLVGDKYEQVEIPQPEDRGILLKDILEENVDEKYTINLSDNKRIRGITESARGLRPHRGDKKKTGISELGRIVNVDQKTDTVTTNHAPTIRVGKIGKGGQGDRVYSVEGKSVNLSANGGGRGAKTGLYNVPNKSYCVPSTYYKENVKSLEKRKKIGLMVNEDMIIRKLTPTECERLQGLPDNYTEGVSNTQRYRALGNAFNVDVIAHILKFL